MPSLNRAELIGNLGRDPEIRHLQNGNKICTLRVATSETWKDANGARQERTEWHQVVIFNPHLIDVAERYCCKGALVHIEGQIQTRSWDDDNGVTRYGTEIVLGQFKGILNVLAGGRAGDGRG